MARICCIAGFVLALSTTAMAGDGTIEINQARALAGGVTASDAAGFPVTVDAPGSYVLTSNLNTTLEADGAIQITADDVTLDLNGFTIAGPVTCTGSGSTLDCGSGIGGTGVDSTGDGTVVMNGVVRGFASDGIDLDISCRVEDVTVTENRSAGLRIDDDCIAVGVIASLNAATGVMGAAATGAVLLTSSARGNKISGIRMSSISSVQGCAANGNGADGIELGSSAVAVYNASSENGSDGIYALGTTLIKGNAVYGNAAWGLNMVTFSGYVLNSSGSNGSGDYLSGVSLGANSP